MSKNIKRKIEEEEDFIHSKIYNNSLKAMLDDEKYIDGVPNKKIAQVLMMTEEEVEKTYQDALKKIRKLLNIEI